MLQEHPFWQSENLIPILTYSMWTLVAVIYLCFLGVCIWRYFLLRKQNRDKEQKAHCSALLFAYLEGEENRKNIKSYFQKNNNQIPLFVEICIELLRDLKGNLEYRLQELFSISSVQKYYKEKLYSSDLGPIADALIFYKYCREFNPNIKRTITSLLDHDNSEIAFAAALAMINSKEMATQFTAMKKLCKRQDISQLAVLELLVIFGESESGDINKRGEMIVKLIQDDGITPGSRIVLIKSLGELQLVNQSSRLYYFLSSYLNGTEAQSEAMTAALLEALGKLQYDAILPHIKKLNKGSESEVLKLSSAKALGALGGKESIILLDELIEDQNENVRFEAMKQLLKIGQPVLNYLPDIRQVSYSEMEKQTLQELIEIKNFQYG